MKKKTLLISTLVIITVIIVTLILKINNIDTTDIEEPTTNYVAIIYHSEMLGIDAVTEYIYYIYPSDDKYVYIKKQSEITISGQQEEKRVGSGNLENKEALKRIKKDINNDKKESAETTISYTYLSDGKTINCSSIDELGDNLFKKNKKV